MIDVEKLVAAAKKDREFAIKIRIARLRALLAQQHASELHKKADELERNGMYQDEARRVIMEGIPDSWGFSVGGDPQSARDALNKLLQLQHKEDPDREMIVSLDIETNLKPGDVMKHYAQLDKLNAVRISADLAKAEEQAMEDQPWDSSIE